MPKWISRWLLISVCVLAGAFILWWARDGVVLIFSLIAYSAVLGYIVSPLCIFFERIMPPMAAAVLAILLPFGLIVWGICFLFPVFIQQFQGLIEQLPELLLRGEIWLEETLRSVSPALETTVMRELGELTKGILPTMTKITSTAGNVAQTFAYILITPMITYYLLKERKRIFLWMEMMAPFRYRSLAVTCAEEIKNVLRVYLRGQLLISLFTGVLTAIGLSFFDIPSSMVLGAQMSVFNLIPYFGPFIGTVPILIVAAADGMGKVIIALLVVFVVQQFESMFFAPRILGATVGVHPVFVIFVLLLGGTLFGIAGFLFALPVSLSIRACVKVVAARKLSPELQDI